MPTFNDTEGFKPSVLVPEADYVYTVIDFKVAISKGGKTSGCDTFEVKFAIDGKPETFVRETLIDHASCAWKIDTFLKSAGVQLAKGESFEFRQDLANKANCKWINPIGLRGHCKLMVEKYEKNGQPRQVNKVAVFYTDKAKLTPDQARRDAAEQAEVNVPFA